MPPPVASIESAALPPPPQNDQEPLRSPVQSQHAATPLGAPPRNLGTLPADDVSWQSTTPRETVQETKSYIVQSGDTLSLIAAKTGSRVSSLKQANGLDGDMIRIGQKLVVPSSHADNAPPQLASVQQEQSHATPIPVRKASVQAQTVAVKMTETVVAKPASDKNEAARMPIVTASQETTAAHAKSDGSVPGASHAAAKEQTDEGQQIAAHAPRATGIAQLRWPARGRILSSYGEREGTLTNDGLDIMVPEGTSVKAAENGVVIYSGDGLKEFGKTVLIRHEDNLVTVYGHNSTVLVQRGQQVRRGDEIAKSGMSGNATSPKLHFEVRKNSSPVNPMKYLEQ